MHDLSQLKVPKWPFLFGDAVMLGLGFFIVWQGGLPLAPWEIAACASCVALGAVLAIIPFFLEHRAVLKSIEAGAVGSAVEKIRELEKIAAQIGATGNLWENAQRESEKTLNAAREISGEMQNELARLKDFLQKANDNEKATLRLEVEKLHRAEAEWLQIQVRTLDHVFALFVAAEKSGQQNLISQIRQFQNACRDTARRIGLAPFVASPSEPFDEQRHKWAEGEKPPANAVVTETLATGYTFQGRLLRPALVRVQNNGSAKVSAKTDDPQNQLPLDTAPARSTTADGDAG